MDTQVMSNRHAGSAPGNLFHQVNGGCNGGWQGQNTRDFQGRGGLSNGNVNEYYGVPGAPVGRRGSVGLSGENRRYNLEIMRDPGIAKDHGWGELGPANGAQVLELLRQAHVLYQRDDLDGAHALCSQTLQLAPGHSETLLLMGAIAYNRRLYSDCLEFNRQAIKSNPSFPEAYSNMGNAYRELRNYQRAVGCYNKAIALSPQFFDAYAGLASVWVDQGNYDHAITAYREALAIRPDVPTIRSDLGNLLKAQGCLQEAKRCYMEALQSQPTFATAWSNLGCVKVDENDIPGALECFEKAVCLDPNFLDAWLNYANVAKESHMYEQALRGYSEVLRISPGHLGAICSCACLHYEQGNLQQAVELFKLTLQYQPNSPDVYCSLGNVLKDLGEPVESKESYVRALQLCPTHADSLNNLGNTFKDEGNLDKAMQLYQKALQVRPLFPAAHSNLASVLKDQHRLAEAFFHYHEAIKINPHFADAYSNLGNALKDMGNVPGAIECYLRAIELKPKFADAHSNLACAYKDLGNIQEAIVYYYRALQIRPDFPDAFANLTHCYELICFWESRSVRMKHLEDSVRAQIASGRIPSVQPHHTMLYPFPPDLSLAIAAAHGKACLDNVRALHLAPYPFTDSRARGHKLAPGERLKIGYVSSDFGNHPTSHLMQSVPGFHDRSQFEVFCFALSPDDGSEYRKKIVAEGEHFVDLSGIASVGDAASVIYNAGIHILINLNGYTKGARNEIFALHPAPIQAMWLGYPGTSGVNYMDYIITDATTTPPELSHQYSENYAYLPDTFFVCDHLQSYPLLLDPNCTTAPGFPTRAKYGLPADRVVYCTFNQLYKIDEEVFGVWCRILKCVPNSVLWLLQFPPAGEANLRKVAARHGVPQEQLHFTPVASKEEHIYRGILADLFLDTPLCNAHTTGTDILWSGTPLLTHPRTHFASRVAASLVRALGLPELVCDTMQQYEDMAVALGNNPTHLAALKAKVSAQRTVAPLFNTRHTVGSLERAYQTMWKRHEEGLAPTHLTTLRP